jgi:type 1 glutamine amidotransferase
MGSEQAMCCRNISAKLLSLLASLVLAGCGATDVSVVAHPARDTTQAPSKIVFLAGPDSHLPGEHEHRAGSALLSEALRLRMPGLHTIDIYGGWPPDESIFDGAAAVVMYCDGGTSHLINDHLETFNRLVEAGVGIVALHYCVEVPKESASATAMLNAIGGYFETWWSVNPTWTADYTTLPNHPVTDRVQPFSLKDEWYFNMRFVERGVTPILAAIPPETTMDRWDGPHSGNSAVRKMVSEGMPQVTAWAFERTNGGRGFGYTGGHYHANWEKAEARELVLNAIEWVAAAPTHPAP